jgi:hypothetical protein
VICNRAGTQHIAAVPWIAALLLLPAAMLVACGDGSSTERLRSAGVTVERLDATPTATIPLGGKAAAPPTAVATPGSPTAEPAAPTAAPTEAVPPLPAATSTVVAPAPPLTGHWIDVDVTQFVVRLMDGESVVREVGPVGVGAQVDTGEYLSTQTGLFYVHNKVEGLAYDAPFDTYISHWVGFDPDKDNGFHSFLKDASGAVVDASTGRVSNGCIRTGEPEAIYAFAEIGMPVWVHA